jgi:hypothetical protein
VDRRQLTKRIERLEAKSLKRKWSPVVIIHGLDGTVSPDSIWPPHPDQLVINARFVDPKTI